MNSVLHPVFALLVTLGLVFSPAINADDTARLFTVRTTQKSPVVVVAAIKAYALQRKWFYLGEIKVKNGAVSLVKICLPAAGKYIWAVGMEYSAMLPCGNLSIYTQAGTTQISLLDPGFMNILHPDPNLKRLGDETRPLFNALLDAVTK